MNLIAKMRFIKNPKRLSNKGMVALSNSTIRKVEQFPMLGLANFFLWGSHFGNHSGGSTHHTHYLTPAAPT